MKYSTSFALCIAALASTITSASGGLFDKLGHRVVGQKLKHSNVDAFSRLFEERFDGAFANDVRDEANKALNFIKKKFNKDGRVLTMTGFSWNSCGSAGDLASVKSLTISPDPLRLPGNVSISFSGSLSQAVTAPVQLSLEIKKKMFIWVSVPCVSDIGSCDYEDVCPLLESFTCPPVFKQYGLPCKCPFKNGDYSLPQSQIQIPDFGLPSFLEDGDFKVKASLSTQNKQILCIDIEFSIE